MPQLPDPFSTSLEEFSVIAELLSQLIAEGKVRLKSSPSSSISFVVKPSILDEIIQNRKLNRDIMSRVTHEISVITSLSLRNRTDSYFDSIIDELNTQRDEELSQNEKDEIKAILIMKENIVKKSIINEKVIRKYFLTRSAKHDFLSDLTWEIVQRRHDKNEGDKARGAVSIVKFDITAKPQFEFLPLPFLLGLEDAQKRSFVVELDRDDVEQLIEELEKLKDLLIKEGGE